MKKNNLTIVLICLLLSNIIAIYFLIHYYNSYMNIKDEIVKNIFVLNGENSNWRLNNGIIIVSNNKLTFKSDSLEYIGQHTLKIRVLSIKVLNENNVLLSVIHQNKNKNFDLIPNNRIQLGASNQQILKNNFQANNPIILKLQYTTYDGRNITDQFQLNAKSIGM